MAGSPGWGSGVGTLHYWRRGRGRRASHRSWLQQQHHQRINPPAACDAAGCWYDVPSFLVYIRMAPMYECSIGPSSTLGFSKVFFGLLIFWGIFRYLLIENSGILVLWYFSCNFICWCVWYYLQNSYISATLCTQNDGTTTTSYVVAIKRLTLIY